MPGRAGIRRSLVARRRHPRLTVLLGLGVLFAASGAAPVQAQSVTPDEAELLNPRVNGDPKNLPRFQTLMKGEPPVFQLPKYGNPPASGAGNTGFDSTNKKKAKKSTIVARPLAPIVVPPPDATLAPVYRQPALSSARINRTASGNHALNVTGSTLRPIRRAAEEDPFAPLGVRAGAFILKPAIEVSSGYDSNPGRIQDGSGSRTTVVAPELQIKSDWSRHEVSANLKGNYSWYHDLPSFNRPMVDLKANGRLDISSHTHADFEGRFVHTTDTPGNPNNPTDIATPPAYNKYGASAGATHRFNRVELTAKGDADRLVYSDASLNDGTPLSLADRNYNQYGGTLRGSYEMLPGVKPFVEGGMDTRVHDLTTDYSGVQRDSDGRSIKVGTTFELTRKLTGEASVGYLTRSYKDPTLSDLKGMTADASLVWAATPLTTATLTAKSTVDETTITGVSGILKQDAGVQIDHSFRRWLIGTAKFGYGIDDYQGDGRKDQRYTASAALTYKLTRELQLKGEFRREWLTSNVPGQDYTANIVMFGLRLQR
jgi:hypothetical protein